MKKTRKGFTLVELLIVVAIMAALAATMTYSMSGSTAKAKAASITANVNACVKVISAHYYDTASEGNNDKLLDVILAGIPTFGSFANTDDSNLIQYTLAADATTATDVKKWTMTVDFSRDPDKEAIATALGKVKGYDNVYKVKNDGSGFEADTANALTISSTWKFKVTLYNGTISKADA